MNPPIQLKKSLQLFITLALLCFGLLPKLQAVNPAPDGCYPGFTTEEGCDALHSLTTGAGNTGLGWRSLFLDTTGSFNTGIGAGALVRNTGDSNTGVGAAALLLNTSGRQNVAVGTDALVSNTTGSENTANGVDALFSNTTGNGNTANGIGALQTNTIGSENTANGIDALQTITIGSDNTANGFDALVSNTTGSNNTADGINALFSNTTGSNNIGLGNDAGSSVTTAYSVICIGTPGNNVDNSCFIGHIFGATSVNGVAVFINSNGQLGTATSSRRFKDEIKPMNDASEALFALKPVSFRYKREIDPASTPRFGLVAEDVEKVNPDLIVRDKQGKPYSVRYEQVNAMLLNEFLKEHRKVQEQDSKLQDQGATIAELKNQIEVLTSGLQKVSAQIELDKPAPQTAENNQ